ncbi:hypothetical protein CIB48_g8335 [Xylaria polymorpha]|nr:hypothetical protein CIB48_g8335 [Xylaria polymorpha]
MVFQRQILRATPRLTAQLRRSRPPLHHPAPSRFHREPNSGARSPSSKRSLSSFIYLDDACQISQPMRSPIRTITGIYDDRIRSYPYGAVVPCMILAGVNAYNLWSEHWEHWSHLPPLEERTEYPYQNIRSKNFPWGDGDKTLFWNDNVNYHNKDKTK